MSEVRFCHRCGSLLRPDELAAARCASCQADLTPLLLRKQPPGVDLRKLARAQRRLMYCIGLILVIQAGNSWAHFASSSSTVAGLLAGLMIWSLIAANLAALVLSVQLMAACGMDLLLRIVLIVLLFAPCINLLVLLGINYRATKLLRAAGVRVGLLGARDEDVVRHISSLHCRNCGYLLVGNVSGICPECGTPLTKR